MALYLSFIRKNIQVKFEWIRLVAACLCKQGLIYKLIHFHEALAE